MRSVISLTQNLVDAHPARLVARLALLLLLLAATTLAAVMDPVAAPRTIALGIIFAVGAALAPDSPAPVVATVVLAACAYRATERVGVAYLAFVFLLLAAHLVAGMYGIGPETAPWSRALLVRWASYGAVLGAVMLVTWGALLLVQADPPPVGVVGLLAAAAALAGAGWWALHAMPERPRL